ncbi:MAG: hypothetical protein ACLFTH_03605 [Candidatus Woesearchaeota archaeon]
MASYLARILISLTDLAIAELETVFDTRVSEVIGRWAVFSCDLDPETLQAKASCLAMSKGVYSLLDIADESSFPRRAANVIENSYRIDVKHTHAKTPELMPVADAIYRELDNPKVDLRDPDHEYLILFSESRIFIAEKLVLITERFFERRSHLLSHNHPTSMNPRIARAMINLSGASSFLDPFCGVGGFLLEGGLLGLNVAGGDISPDMVSKAKDNLKRFGLDIPVSLCDARSWDLPVEAIISDLPYGRNSPVSESLDLLYESFFSKAASITDRLIIGSLADFPLENLLDTDNWQVSCHFDIYIHKSMVRRISVIEKKK